MSRWAVASLCLLACVVVAAGSGHDASLSVSNRTQAVLALDRLYAAQLRHQEYQRRANKPTPVGALAPYLAYNYQVATKLFWHSVTAYCTDDPSLADWSCTSCGQFGPFTITQVMDDTANQGYVGYFTQGLPASPINDGTGRVRASDPFVVISFRGTVEGDIKDWIEDLSFSKFAAFDSDYPDVEVHEGFWGAYQDMKPKLLTGLQAALSASGARTVLVTGHSLGAAMAELAAMDLKLNVYPHLNYASYTQGCPRVGNADFSGLYSAMMNTSFREVHYADVVPHLPPLLLNFAHGPTEIWFAEDWSTYSVCNSTMSGEDPHCSNSLLAPISIPDHLHYRNVEMGGYCTSGKKMAAETPEPVQVDSAEMAEEDAQAVQEPPAAPVVNQVSAPVETAQPRKAKIMLTEF